MTLEDNRRINLTDLEVLNLQPPNIFSYNDVTSFWSKEAKLHGSFPPYNLSKNSDSTKFNLKLAIAGFGPEDISVSVEDNHLLIKGNAETLTLDTGSTYIHKGIAERSFTRSFTLGDYVEIKDLSYKNGILDIDMELVLPEHKKPKVFKIKT